MASPVADSYYSASDAIYAGRYGPPDWSPAAGEVKAISKSAGFYGTNGGATMGEIDPIYQSWHPTPSDPNYYPFGTPSATFNSMPANCGMGFNSDTRQYFGYGAGHSAINVPAPFAFDLNDLKWKWLDTPLPFDAFKLMIDAGVPDVTRFYTELYYPPEQYNYDWGDINGSWSGWPAGFGRPGIIQPVTGHNRCNLCHIPAAGMGNLKGGFFYRIEGTGRFGGNYAKTSHIFDYDTSLWSRTNAFTGASSSSTGIGTVYDPITNKVVMTGQGQVSSTEHFVFDVLTKTWSTRNSTVGIACADDFGGHELHPPSRLHIYVCPRNSSDVPTPSGDRFAFYACSFDDIVGSGSFTPTRLTVNVVSTWPRHTATYFSGLVLNVGWCYCPDDECFYAAPAYHGDNKYWRLAPPVGAVTQNDYLIGTWTITEHTFTTGTWDSIPGAGYANDYGRHHWDSRSRAFIWHGGSLTAPVMAWRPAGL